MLRVVVDEKLVEDGGEYEVKKEEEERVDFLD